LSVRISFPKPKLAQLLRTPGGVPVVEALAKANANLAELKPDCAKALRELADQIVGAFDAASRAERPSGAELYALSVKGVGLGQIAGLPEVDMTLVSLCRLTDHFDQSGHWDLDALRVHVQTLQILLSGAEFSPAAMREVLAGLEKVNRRYRSADEAPPSP
jgi:hypothetical protein